ncbi:MAG: hypothetical protein K0R39_2942 [Symbiobacteriaceae bacterium]|nr:hypothetical protein [Symbiobacteriaceae bacterium]
MHPQRAADGPGRRAWPAAICSATASLLTFTAGNLPEARVWVGKQVDQPLGGADDVLGGLELFFEHLPLTVGFAEPVEDRAEMDRVLRKMGELAGQILDPVGVAGPASGPPGTQPVPPVRPGAPACHRPREWASHPPTAPDRNPAPVSFFRPATRGPVQQPFCPRSLPSRADPEYLAYSLYVFPDGKTRIIRKGSPTDKPYAAAPARPCAAAPGRPPAGRWPRRLHANTADLGFLQLRQNPRNQGAKLAHLGQGPQPQFDISENHGSILHTPGPPPHTPILTT